MTSPDVQRAIETVWRLESPKVIAGLTRIVRDLALAEDLAHDALVAALEQWPTQGMPRNPGAWLMATAKHRAIDQLRRRTMLVEKHGQLARDIEDGRSDPATDLAAAMDDDIGDDLLRLIFTACHPVLATEARVALTLAKAQVPFEVPRGPERQERLSSVLEVLHLVFNEGYSATAGDDWVRPSLCGEALRLGRVLAELVPEEPEVHGLVALMELQSSRLRARVGPNGEPVRLLGQNRAGWDRLLIGRGVTALRRAERLTDSPGPYVLQAAIASCHALATVPEATDWSLIAGLYAALVDAVLAEGALSGYHYAPSVRGDLLEKLGRRTEAVAEFERAAALTKNARERDLLLGRAQACQTPSS